MRENSGQSLMNEMINENHSLEYYLNLDIPEKFR